MEARRACNGGKDLPIRCKVFLGLSKEDEATLFALQTGISTCLTAGERLRANLVARNPDAIHFVRATVDTGVEFAYDGIRRPGRSTASKQHIRSMPVQRNARNRSLRKKKTQLNENRVCQAGGCNEKQ